MTREEKTVGDSSGVQAVEIGAKVLRALVMAGRPVPLKMVTNAVGMPRAKVHRYLASLVRCGLACQEELTGHYGLGPFAVQMGISSLGTLDSDALGRQAIRELRDSLGITACLCVWGEGPTVIAVEAAESAVFVGLRAGSRLPLIGSATGHVFMAYLPARVWRPYVPSEKKGQPVDQSLLDNILKSRIAGVSDQVMTGMSGFAAPVLNHTGAICATLTLAGPTGTFDEALNGKVARALLLRADQLSARLGNVALKNTLHD